MGRLFIRFAVACGVASLLWVATPAEACEKHARKKTEVQRAKSKLGPAAKRKPLLTASAKTGVPRLDEALVSKCSCSSQADCTCKRGQCECKKCGGSKRSRVMIAPLKGQREPALIPVPTRLDASAGEFI